MADPYIGEIKLVPYNFPPLGWAYCNGDLLPISQYEALFSLLGTTYGGDGVTSFGLPDLRGRLAMHRGTGPGMSFVEGEVSGSETVTLNNQQLPTHGHGVSVSSALGNQPHPAGEHLGMSPLGLGYVFGDTADGTMPSNAIAASGGGQPHENLQPYLALHYIIALEGIYPPQQ